MVNFREKTFSKKAIGRLAAYIKKYPLIPISTASLGVGIANHVLNKRKKDNDIDLQKRQITAMENLAKALTDTKKVIEKEERSRKKELEKKKESGSTKFKEKSKKK